MSTLIIAEAGVNHNGDESLAIALIDSAANAGADIVKFQTFKAKDLVTETAAQAAYQTTNTGKSESQLAMLSRLQLSFDAHHRLIQHCLRRNIAFLSTAFDTDSLAFLVDDLGLQTLKIPSGEVTNAPFVLEHARTGCDLIMSTGMCDLADIETALGVLAFGLTQPKSAVPTRAAFKEAYASANGQQALAEKVTLLHCTTEYPTPLAEVNLRVLDTFTQAFGLAVGYSDHTQGIVVPTAAVARGARVIEKHFTLSREMEGPDHKASIEPSELEAMVQSIRAVEIALGSSVKMPTPTEIANSQVVRKSLIAARAIKAGEPFTTQNLTVKRPGQGISPLNYWAFLSTNAKRDYQPGDLIDE